MAAVVLNLRAPAPQPETTLSALRGAPLSALLPEGRLVELSGSEGTSARVTLAIGLLARAQAEGQPCVWVQPEGGGLFPPDLVARGIDLDALVVVHVPERAGAVGLARAAELCLRSGGFGAVVVDMTAGEAKGAASSSRLAQLAREHAAWLVVLTEKSRGHGSLGPLVGVRIDAHRTRVSAKLFHVIAEVLKDKSGTELDPSPLLCSPPIGAG